MTNEHNKDDSNVDIWSDLDGLNLDDSQDVGTQGLDDDIFNESGNEDGINLDGLDLDPISQENDHDEHDDEDNNYDDDDYDDEVPQGSKPIDKKKTYAIVAGALIGMSALIGGGLYVKSSAGKKAAQNQMQFVPDPIAQPLPEVVQNIAPQPEPVQERSQDYPQEQPQELEPVFAGDDMPALDGQSLLIETSVSNEVVEGILVRLDDLEARLDGAITNMDVLAETLIKSKVVVDGYADKIDALEKELDRVNKILLKVEEDIKEQALTIDSDEKADDKADKKESDESTDAKKDTGAKAQDEKPKAAEVKKEPAQVKKAAPAPKKVAAPKPNLKRFSVVATYPSGSNPEKAWVTDGNKLHELRVGSRIGGATVTAIEGTTVKTSAGNIGTGL